MNQYPEPIQNLIEEFNKFPGIGPKTSERFTYYLLQRPVSEIEKLTRALQVIQKRINTCTQCFNLSETSPCSICQNKSRNNTILCVVAQSPQISLFEKTGEHKGLYFVLGGVLNPVDGVTPDNLRIKQLIERLKNSQPKIQEVILAFNLDVEGESTAIYLRKILRPYVQKITSLARGLPVGGDLDYADEITLASALKGRH
ncbi:recombination mediator RecR [Patescibacteria group bacterium]|nr:recombination mediator RecR [Patescibacteria group bacterium]MBU1890357.1 recombination mediator RecR [Patescibacteria group bacterium]